MPIFDWSTTPASNTTLEGVTSAENMLPGLLNNLIRAVASGIKGALTFVAASSADTITATLAPVPGGLVDGMQVFVRAAAANTSTTPTLNINSLGAKTIVKEGGQALVVGDIRGAGHMLHLAYRSSATQWELLNPVYHASNVARTDLANTFTADQIFSGTSGTASGPVVDIYHNSASPAASDRVAEITASGNDSGTNKTTYGFLQCKIDDPADGSEDAHWDMGNIIAGSGAGTVRHSWGAGYFLSGATGGDPGTGKVNAQDYQVNGVPIGPSTKPSFSAHKNGTNQTINDNTATKVTFGSENFDLGSYFDTTNSRWTPPAGKVRLSAGVTLANGAASGDFNVYIYKNGSLVRSTYAYINALALVIFMCVTDIFDTNGTDYWEIFVNQSTGGSKSLSGGTTLTWLSGEMI